MKRGAADFCTAEDHGHRQVEVILTLVLLFFSGVVHAWSADSLFLSGLVHAWSVDYFSLWQFFWLGDDAGRPATITQQPPDSNGTYFGSSMEKALQS